MFSRKTVLDIGADVGSTAAYFLEKGASLVYAVEGDPVYFAQLERNAQIEPKIKPIFLFIDNTEKWLDLLSLRPDIVKVDCEGCEKYLADVSDSVFGTIHEWMIEAHTQTLFEILMEKLRQNHYVVSFYQYTNHLKICLGWRI